MIGEDQITTLAWQSTADARNSCDNYFAKTPGVIDLDEYEREYIFLDLISYH